MTTLPTETAGDVRALGARIAVLPIGSFEQHGDHLPLATDSLIASRIAVEISRAYDLLLLPAITISCSHEHTGAGPAVSLRASTLDRIVGDVAASLARSGVHRLVLVNCHGGNYVLSNVVQEANEQARRMTLFPSRTDWETARRDAGLTTNGHDDMHAGELETSLLLHAHPELVRPTYKTADHLAPYRPHLLALGVHGYSDTGVIGSPSLATAQKGKLVLESLTQSFADHVELLKSVPPATG
jgi:creatinine amidohydrolase